MPGLGTMGGLADAWNARLKEGEYRWVPPRDEPHGRDELERTADARRRFAEYDLDGVTPVKYPRDGPELREGYEDHRAFAANVETGWRGGDRAERCEERPIYESEQEKSRTADEPGGCVDGVRKNYGEHEYGRDKHHGLFEAREARADADRGLLRGVAVGEEVVRFHGVQMRGHGA